MFVQKACREQTNSVFHDSRITGIQIIAQYYYCNEVITFNYVYELFYYCGLYERLTWKAHQMASQ